MRWVSGSCRSPTAPPVRAGHVEVAQADRAPARAPGASDGELSVDGELGGAVRVGRPGRGGLGDRHLAPARRRWRRWRRRRAGARRRPASRRAGPGCRRRCCASSAPGCSIDSPTSDFAAKCSTPSYAGPSASTAAASSARVPSTSRAPSGTASACPVDRSSSTVTSCPASQQVRGDDAADVAGAAGDQQLHAAPSLSRRSWLSQRVEPSPGVHTAKIGADGRPAATVH